MRGASVVDGVRVPAVVVVAAGVFVDTAVFVGLAPKVLMVQLPIAPTATVAPRPVTNLLLVNAFFERSGVEFVMSGGTPVS